jgi:hypothetical protein
MQIDDRVKSQILLAALERRYEATDKIRDRVYAISIWTLGIFLAGSGLIVQGNILLGVPGKVFLGMAVVFAYGVVVFYVKDLERGFRNQFRAAVRIEKLLGFYEEGFFAPDEALYPPQWAEMGTKAAKGRFFTITYLLLSLGALVLIAAIGLSGLLF